MDFGKLFDQSSAVRLKGYLTCIASLSGDYSLGSARVAITADLLDRLLDIELESLAEKYAFSTELQVARLGGKERSPLPRGSAETAIAYLDRLLKSEVEARSKQARKMVESMLSSTSMFDQVRKSSLVLGDSWRQLDRLTKSSIIASDVAPSFDSNSLGFNNPMLSQATRIARERVEDREIVRLISETSVQSGKTLQELADAASSLLDKLDQRDEEAKRATKVQLRWAVGSVVVSAIVAAASYCQDRSNILSGDKWQASVLAELKATNIRDAASHSHKNLPQDEVRKISAEVMSIEAADEKK